MCKSLVPNQSSPLWAACFAAAVLAAGGLWADEPTSCPLQSACREVGVPMLSKIPFVSRLFRNVGSGSDQPCCEAIERIGVDFDFVAAPGSTVCTGGKCAAAACTSGKCEPGVGQSACTAASSEASGCKTSACTTSACKTAGSNCPGQPVAHTAEAECGKECACPCSGPVSSCPVANGPVFGFVVRHAGAEVCCPPGTACFPAGMDAVAQVCATEHCAVSRKTVPGDCCCAKAAGSCGCAAAVTCHIERGLWERIVEVTAAAASAEVALEMQDTVASAREELLGSLVESQMENAVLAAKLEAHESIQELAGELRELAAENARLKAHQELASQREDLMREAVQLAIENERLKQRVAEFERDQAAARTASKPEAGRTH